MKIFQANELKLYFFILILVYLPYFFYNIFLLQIRPDLLLITIFYFSIIKRFNINLFYLVFVGLLNDELHNNVLGTQAFIYVLVNFFGSNNANSLYKQKFSIVLVSFAAITIASIAVKYFVTFIVATEPIFLKNELISAMTTILLYTHLHYLFTVKLHWFMYPDER